MDSFSIPEWIAIIALIVSALSAVFSGKAARAAADQVKLMKEESERRDRPYVVGHFRHSEGLFYFSLKNNGNTAALDVDIKFVGDSPDTYAGRKLAEANIFKNPVKILPVGESYDLVVDTGFNLLAEGKQTRFVIIASYQSISGQKFLEHTELDLESYRGTTSIDSSIVQSLKKINETLKKIK